MSSRLRKPGARVKRGLSSIHSEMSTMADDLAGNPLPELRQEAADIRAALAYIDAAIAAATGSTP